MVHLFINERFDAIIIHTLVAVGAVTFEDRQ